MTQIWNEEKACVPTSMLRDCATAILENLSSSDLNDYVRRRHFAPGRSATCETIQRQIFPGCLDKAREIKAATKATRMTRRNSSKSFTCWRCGQKGHFRIGCRLQVDNMKVDAEKSMQNTTNSMKEEFNGDMTKLLKKIEERIAKLHQQHEAAMGELKEITADRDRDMNNLLKQNEQEVPLRKLWIRWRKNLENVIADAKKARVKEDESNMRDRLAQLELENKKVKSDLNNAFDDAQLKLRSENAK
nr:unnamed protein product [Callosobruchus chinensis]